MSKTFGGRNNSVVRAPDGSMIKKKELDAMDLEKAVNDNWDRNAECLKNDYGVSDERIEEIRSELHELNRKVGLY